MTHHETTPTHGSPTRIRIVSHQIRDRLHQGMHVRLLLSNGERRSVWVPRQVLSRALAGERIDALAVAPTDGGPPLGRLADGLLVRLARDVPTTHDSIELAPMRDVGPTASNKASMWAMVGLFSMMAIAAAASCVAVLYLLFA